MIRILLCLFFMLLSSGAVPAGQLKIVHISDVHISLNKDNYGNRNIKRSALNLQKAVNSINAMEDVDFTVFSGDNIDDYRSEDLIKFCEITKKLEKPYYVAIGNHDAFAYGDLTKEKYLQILKKHNKNQKKAEPSYYVRPNKDLVLVVLDGVINRIPSSFGYYSDETLAWLDKVLTKFKKKNVIIVQHFPLVEPYEKKSHRVKYPEKYENLLKKHENVKAILSGHYHKYNLVKRDGIYHVSAPALVSFNSRYLIVTINYDDDSFELDTEVITQE